MTEVKHLIPIKHPQSVFQDAQVEWLVRPRTIFARTLKEGLGTDVLKKYFSVSERLEARGGAASITTDHGQIETWLSTREGYVGMDVEHSLRVGMRAVYYFGTEADAADGEQVTCEIDYFEGSSYLPQARDDEGVIPRGNVDRRNPQLQLVSRALSTLDELLS